MRKKLSFLLVGFLFCTLSVFAQNAIKGVVVDKDTKEPLIGVSIFLVSEKKGTATDLDGSFNLKVANVSGKIEISYVGYKTQTVDATANLGRIEMEIDAVGLRDVVVTSSVAVSRKTPVAMTSIEADFIEVKLGSKEFPEILKSTPGIYATREGGGYGDSRVNLRGFESENIAVMVNGVPMNDMEWGGLYWSNWAGLSDVTRFMQVQRGLGASKIAAPSVGGSINVVTKTVDAKKGGSVYYGLGNNGYNKLTFNVSTGLMDNGWAVTLLGGKTWSDGYVQGTDYEAYNWFLNVSKMLGDSHQISLTAFGSPQWHHQRKDQLLISEWAMLPKGARYQYNAGYGYDDAGNFKTFNRNIYHKPQISLNHIWDINAKSNLSTALYLSLGDGGGYSGVGNNRSAYYGSTDGRVNNYYRRNDGPIGQRPDGTSVNFGTYDFGTLQKENAENVNGSQLAIQNAINNHVWVGLLSTYSNRITDEIELQGGIDIRYYKGIHKTEIQDLLGGAFLIDPERALTGKFKNDAEWKNEKLKVGDIVYRNYDGFVMQEGVFGQAEYSKDALSAFVSGSFNVSNYWRLEKYSLDRVKSETKNKAGFGIKGGANYNINENHNAFFNIGYFSRTPFFSNGVFLNAQKSNAMNQGGLNEKVFSIEAGYGFQSRYLNATINVYRTAWNDKTMVKYLNASNPEDGYINLSGVNALHQGVELEFRSKPVKGLELTGMVSLGNWKWKDNASGYLYDGNGNAIDKDKNVVEPGSPTHVSATVNLEGTHVGNSAQTTMALGANYEFFKNFRMGLDYNLYGRNYAKYSVNIASWGVNNFAQPWRIPNANVFDLHLNYRFDIAGLKASLNANVDNLLDAVYITDATDGGNGKAETAKVYYGFGRTWSVSMKVMF